MAHAQTGIVVMCNAANYAQAVAHQSFVHSSVVPVSICSSISSRSITFLITVPVTVLEPKSFQLLFQFQPETKIISMVVPIAVLKPKLFQLFFQFKFWNLNI